MEKLDLRFWFKNPQVGLRTRSILQGPDLHHFVKWTYENVTKKSGIRKVYETIRNTLVTFL